LNIHASYLPFGRGIGTVLFAIIYPVTLGSSIHILDYDIDLGDILIQRRFVLTDTLISQRMLYQFWLSHASSLFIENIEPLLEGELSPEKQSSTVSSPYLCRDESELHLSILSKGWDSSIEEIQCVSLALSLRLASFNLCPND
jgi:methionyl-tRNA formyltransferase